MTQIRRDAEWIYKTLGEAFNRESPWPWSSYSRIHLRSITPEAKRCNDDVNIAALLLEIDFIEFEVETFGDGHYCQHHPDDPAHGKDCYKLDKQ